MVTVKTKVETTDLESYYGTYPKKDKSGLVRIGDIEKDDIFETLVRAYGVGLDETATEYDIQVQEWYGKFPYESFPYAFGVDIAAQIRQDRINRARRVGLPDDASEVEIVVAERAKARKFQVERDISRRENAKAVSLPADATEQDIRVAMLKGNHSGNFKMNPEHLNTEVTRIEAEEKKTKDSEAKTLEENRKLEAARLSAINKLGAVSR